MVGEKVRPTIDICFKEKEERERAKYNLYNIGIQSWGILHEKSIRERERKCLEWNRQAEREREIDRWVVDG